MKEIFKYVNGYENKYQVSNLGRVISLDYNDTGKSVELKCELTNSGYYRVSLSKCGQVKRHSIHRLVAEAFLNNDNNLPQVNHKDENKTNNDVNNLEWCTRQYNIDYSFSKSIIQCDINGNIITKWTSICDASRNGFDKSSIIKCLKGKRKTCGGFIWRYMDE